MKYDYLIVGAGMFGAVFAERATAAGKTVLVIDQRPHVGGNCYTREVEGIQIHEYGPHIFHTNNEKVWNYIRQFAKFNHFINRVKVNSGGRIYSFPVNMMTFHQLWGVTTPDEAKRRRVEQVEQTHNPQNIEERLLSRVGRQIYETFYHGYTIKHWRTSPRNLPASIGDRIPIRFTYDDNYYNDCFQGIPIGGYTPIFERLLNRAEVRLQTPLESIRNWRSIAKKMVYSGRPDSLLSYQFGELAYLTLDFRHEVSTGDYQGVAQMNFPEIDVPYTRCVEHKHFEFGTQRSTVITREYPTDWHSAATPYYPVPGNEERYARYRDEILQTGDIILGGRLGRHQYFDMHMVIANALDQAEKELSTRSSL